jgi:hypothetical protein
MRKTLTIGSLLLATLISTPSYADKITDQIQESLTAYAAKDYKTAIDELKFVTAALQKLNSAENKKLLPEALAGWTTEKVNNDGTQMVMSVLGGGGTSIKGSYKRDKEQVNIDIMANSPMLAMLAMQINNPMLTAADDNMQSYRYKKIKGIKETKTNESSITLILAGQIMIKVTGRYLKDAATLEQYLDAIDMDKLKATLLDS